MTPFTTRTVDVKVGSKMCKVLVDNVTLVDVSTLPLTTQSSNGKIKIASGNRELYPTLGSLPEQLYGSSYRMACHVADNKLDLRRTAFRKSAARAARMKAK